MRRRTTKRKISIRPKHLLIACSILCLALIVLSFQYKKQFSPVKTAVGGFITPMQKGINTVGNYISKKLEIFSNIRELSAENEKLKLENEALKSQNMLLTQLTHELDGLRSLYRVGEKYSDYPKVAAHVIDKDSNSFYSVFLVDKGSDDGISVDMNVIADNGLVGIVTEVGKNYAKIRSIIDDTSYVSGMFLKTSDNCDIKGDLTLLDTGFIRAEAIGLNAKIEDNYEVVTSNISSKYLPGILIGYISNIEVDSSKMSKSGYIRPAVDFEHLEEVLIITKLKEGLKPLESDDNSNNK